MNCKMHGKKEKLLIACVHLTEGSATKYVKILEDTLLCVNCAQISLFDPGLGRVVCEHCFADMVNRKGLRQVG